jgi:predicted O-methyltransferase YrrM
MLDPPRHAVKHATIHLDLTFAEMAIGADIDRLIDALLNSPEAWRELQRRLKPKAPQLAESSAQRLDADDLQGFLESLLILLARGAFRDGPTATRFFKSAERMGFHVLPNHFYSPVPTVSELPASIWTTRMDAQWMGAADSQLALVEQLLRWSPELIATASLPDAADGRYRFSESSFPPLDAAVYYGILREFKPARVIEIGSGASTMIVAQAAVTGPDMQVECIDPFPNAAVRNGLPGVTQLIEKRVQEVPLEKFDALGQNDILFIDSSHVSRIGSDVNYVVLQVLPRLGPGVLVHFHDIFLPYEYPRAWIEDLRLFWNEQYLVQAFLTFNDRFRVLISNALLSKDHGDRVFGMAPGLPKHGGASLWIQRTPS